MVVVAIGRQRFLYIHKDKYSMHLPRKEQVPMKRSSRQILARLESSGIHFSTSKKM